MKKTARMLQEISHSQWLCASLLGIKVIFTYKDSLVDGHTRHPCKRPYLNAKLKQKTGGNSLACFFFFYYLSENKPPKKPPNYLKAFVTLFSKTSKC